MRPGNVTDESTPLAAPLASARLEQGSRSSRCLLPCHIGCFSRVTPMTQDTEGVRSMHEHQWLAEQFEAKRTHLQAVAYRMLGSLSEADDAVQEAWLHLSRSDPSA